MLDAINLYPDAFGMDISDLSLKIIKLKKKRGKLGLACFGESIISPGIIKNGKVKKEKELTKIIEQAIINVESGKLDTPYGIISLPEEKAFLRVIQMPIMNDQELKQAIYFEAENYIPLPIQEVYFDFQVIPLLAKDQQHLDVLIAAMPKNVVDPYLSCLKKAGVQPVAFEVESSAMCRALIKNGENMDDPILLIDLGSTRTSFIVFSDESLRLTCFAPICSQKFTEEISRFLSIGLKDAEKIKIKYGIQDSKKITLKAKKGSKQFDREIAIEKKIFCALAPILTDLVKQIKKSLNFYSSHISKTNHSHSQKHIKKILLCGGGACLKGIDDFFSSELDLSVEIGNPWVNISDQSLLSARQSIKYTIAIGLALRGVKPVK